MNDPKVVRITIEYEDQSKFFAEGEDADKIWKWWQSIEGLAIAHGASFDGKRLEYEKAPETENSKEKG